MSCTVGWVASQRFKLHNPLAFSNNSYHTNYHSLTQLAVNFLTAYFDAECLETRNYIWLIIYSQFLVNSLTSRKHSRNIYGVLNDSRLYEWKSPIGSWKNWMEKYLRMYTWRSKLVIHIKDHMNLKSFLKFILHDSRLKRSPGHGRAHWGNTERKEQEILT